MSWEEYVRRVVPYTAGEQPSDPDIIKLNTNECPYPPAPGVRAAMESLAKEADRFRLYPDPDASVLADAIAAQYGLSEDEVFVGVGSDDVLALSFLTFFGGGKELLFPDITYSFYPVWADLFGIPYRQIPLTDSFEIDPAAYIPALSKKENGGVIFPNPNAPTGLEASQDTVERIVRGNPDSVVIVDEAYIDFGGTTALPLIRKYDNLLVVQTFSKSRAMAGARIGFAMGDPKLIGYLKDVKFSFNSYTMNLPSLMAGKAAVEDRQYFDDIRQKVIDTRERFKRDLKQLGFVFPDSGANFVFAAHPDVPGPELFAQLRARGILVRHWDKPGISEYLRITIGTDDQMKKVTEALRDILGSR